MKSTNPVKMLSPFSGYKYVLRQIVAALVMSQTHVVLGVLVASGGLLVASSQPGGAFQHLTPSQLTWSLSISSFGLAAGSLSSAPLTNSFGTLRVAAFSCVLNLAAHTCLLVARAAPLLLTGRILQGAFIGLNIGNSRVYIAEVSDERLRGVLCHIPALVISIGFLTTFGLGGHVPWQWAVFGVGCLPSVIHIAGALTLPPSARWLVSRGGADTHVQRSIRFFRGEEHDALKEIEEIRALSGGDVQKSSSLLDQLRLTLTCWDFAKPVLLLLGQFAFDAFCGGLTIAQFAPLIFRQAAPGLNPHTCTLYLAGFQFLALCVSGVLIKRVGRRVVVSVAAVTGAVGCSLVALSSLAGPPFSELPWLALVGVLLANAAAQAGIAPISYIFLSELLPTAIRPLFSNCFIVYVSFVNWAAMQLFPIASRHLGTGGLFVCIAGACCMQLTYAVCFLPETKDLTLEDVQKRHFSSRRKVEETSVSSKPIDKTNVNQCFDNAAAA